MFDEQLVAFLESGCSVIVGTVSDDGEPCARRGWGIDVVDAAAGRLRVLVEAAGDGPRGPGVEGWQGARIAVTGADVETLFSVQCKGAVVAAHEPTAADERRHEEFCAAMFQVIADVDHFPADLIERMRPNVLVALDVVVGELFDQTPGPHAGSPITGSPGPGAGA